ncbi:MAG: hypothetical protein ACRDQ5_28510 [Sciscionella sp.]
MKTITLRLSDEAYESVKGYAEDMRRRCAAHGRWMAANPDAVAFAEARADRNRDELAGR